jgi:hypothetical protein
MSLQPFILTNDDIIIDSAASKKDLKDFDVSKVPFSHLSSLLGKITFIDPDAAKKAYAICAFYDKKFRTMSPKPIVDTLESLQKQFHGLPFSDDVIHMKNELNLRQHSATLNNMTAFLKQFVKQIQNKDIFGKNSTLDSIKKITLENIPNAFDQQSTIAIAMEMPEQAFSINGNEIVLNSKTSTNDLQKADLSEAKPEYIFNSLRKINNASLQSVREARLLAYMYNLKMFQIVQEQEKANTLQTDVQLSPIEQMRLKIQETKKSTTQADKQLDLTMINTSLVHLVTALKNGIYMSNVHNTHLDVVAQNTQKIIPGFFQK